MGTYVEKLKAQQAGVNAAAALVGYNLALELLTNSAKPEVIIKEVVKEVEVQPTNGTVASAELIAENEELRSQVADLEAKYQSILGELVAFRAELNELKN